MKKLIIFLSPEDGGLGLGTTSTSILFLTIITVIIIGISLRRNEEGEPRTHI